jgi:hypothetical protein
VRATWESIRIPFAAMGRSCNRTCHVTPCPLFLQERAARATDPAPARRFNPAPGCARHHWAFSFVWTGLDALNISSIRSVTT